ARVVRCSWTKLASSEAALHPLGSRDGWFRDSRTALTFRSEGSMSPRGLFLTGMVVVTGVVVIWIDLRLTSRTGPVSLDDADPAARAAAIRNLSRPGSPLPLPALRRALQDENADVRLLAAMTLSREPWEDQEVVAALVQALADPHKGVRRAAA